MVEICWVPGFTEGSWIVWAGGGVTIDGGSFINGFMSSEYSTNLSNIRLGPEALPWFVTMTVCVLNCMTDELNRIALYTLSVPVGCVNNVGLPPSTDIVAVTFPPPPGRVIYVINACPK